MKFKYIYILLFLFSISLGEKRDDNDGVGYNFSAGSNGSFRIGDYGYPSNPMNDRAKGYSIQGKVKNGLLNFGAYIDWDYNPSGGWGEYAYLPSVAFMAGVPGYLPASDFNWIELDTVNTDGQSIEVWVSDKTFITENCQDELTHCDAYAAWAEVRDIITDQPSRFSGIAYNIANDRGDVALRRSNVGDFGTERYECNGAIGDDQNQCENNNGEWEYNDQLAAYAANAIFEWVLDSEDERIFIFMESDEVIPNNGDSMVGLIYPWAFRPKLETRFDEYDRYDYGSDDEEWTDDDYYSFYGATTSESWFSRWNPKTNTDWHAANKAAINTHQTDVVSEDLFANTVFTGSGDEYPLLAHSNYLSTWPIAFNQETLEDEPFWPGWYADEYYGDDPDLWEEAGINASLCADNQSRANPECWKELPGRFISDSDIYMEFDDRWAHRANMVDSNNEYEQTGYPLGVTVMSMAHSYGVSYAEDIMFVTVKVRNESGDYDYAFKRNADGEEELLRDGNDQIISGEGLIMPDGTKLNGGAGFNYEKVALGFYMDADVLMGNLEGYNSALHTNADDYMEYYDCKNPDIVNSEEWAPFTDGCPVIDGEELRISMAMIYDFDGESGGVEGFGYGSQGGNSGGLGIVATQLLDSPYATDPVDLNNDGITDIFPKQKLKMTDWHWFDWYNRPGVVSREGNNNCCAGDPGKSMAKNKEEIQYKLLSGDNSNLTDAEKVWFFHTANPDTDLDSELNPHFDSLEGLQETSFFNQDPAGLDCVLMMSCAPFDLKVGEEVDFSFCIIFGEDRSDLLKNAEFAQIMYNAHYQGYTAPRKPKVSVTADHNQVKLHWTDAAEVSKDVITNYSDFEGYKIYKSTDGGVTWGNSVQKIYDGDNVFVGWQPYEQFDLSAAQDEAFCVLGFKEHCYVNGILQENIEDKDICEISGFCSDLESITEEACTSNGGTWETGQFLHFSDSNNDGVWNEGEEYTCKDEDNIKRGIQVSGADPKAPWFNLGCNSGWGHCSASEFCTKEACEEEGFDWISIVPCNCSNPSLSTKADCENDGYDWACDFYQDEDGTYQYTFIDNNVTDGFEYTYSITAYDTGVMSDIININQDDSGEWVADTVSVPDPNGWGEINSFQYLENSKGTTTYDDNFVKIIPGYIPQTNWSKVNVIPNPFIVHSRFETDEYSLRIMFTGLPEDCRIKIFTVTGELVTQFNHSSPSSGFEYWNLRNQNNQEVAPGLYLFTIEDLTNTNNEPYVGKFVIIR